MAGGIRSSASRMHARSSSASTPATGSAHSGVRADRISRYARSVAARRWFALGLAVATRGMDHLRNRVTLEINAKINDSPDFKAELYGGPVSAEPNSYDGKELAVRRCENIYAVGDSVGMCRFTTKLFNSPSLPGYEEFADQVANVTGIELSKEAIDGIGLNVMGVERLINAKLGVTRADDTLPKRWFEEAIGVGPYKGEKIDRGEFDKMLSRFYEVSNLTEEGLPKAEWRGELETVLTT